MALDISFDEEVDAAYLRLADKDRARNSVNQIAIETDEAGGYLVIDIDADGRLLGIEVLDARSLLPDKILNALFD